MPNDFTQGQNANNQKSMSLNLDALGDAANQTVNMGSGEKPILKEEVEAEIISTDFRLMNQLQSNQNDPAKKYFNTIFAIETKFSYKDESGNVIETTSRDNYGGLRYFPVLDETGNLAGSISRMPDTSLLEDYISRCGDEIISGAENVVLEIDLNERIASEVLRLSEKYRKKVYAIVGNMSVILAHPEFLQHTDCFICNEIEAGRLFDSEVVPAFSPEQMLEYLPTAAKAAGIHSMVVTMGVHGAVYYDGETEDVGICPIYPAKVVDTSGAGDAFFSGTVMGLTRRLPLREAVCYGAKLASLTIAGEENACPMIPDFFNQQMTLFD